MAFRPQSSNLFISYASFHVRFRLFSRKAKHPSDLIFGLLIPYILFNTAWWFFSGAIDGKVELSIVNQGWGLWYLMALFSMRLLLPAIKDIKGIIPLSILIAILAGCSREFGGYLSISRTLCFLPYFLMGYFATTDCIRALSRRKILSVLAALLLICIFLFFWRNSRQAFASRLLEIMYLEQAYTNLGFAKVAGMGFRTLSYVLAVIIGAGILAAVPTRKCFLSRFGINSIVIYLSHPYIITMLQHLVPGLPSMSGQLQPAAFVTVASLACESVIALTNGGVLYNYAFKKL